MKLVLSSHKVSLTDSIRDHVRSRIQKLESQDGHALSAFVNLERDHEGVPKKKFICTVRVNLPGQTLLARDAEDDLYKAIDLVTKKIQQQIRKRHSKFKAKNTRVAASAKRALLTLAA